MVTAGRILKELGLDRDLTVYFVGTVIEEDCDGLCWKYIIEEDGIRPEVVVSTEPTDGGLYRGQRGRMEIEVTFKGVSSPRFGALSAARTRSTWRPAPASPWRS